MVNRDPYVARALAAMKAAPAERWTLSKLARIAGLSRAAFARHFTQEMKTSPLKWLSHHRLQLAQRRLLEANAPLWIIAHELGYRCEFAFAKAFKREWGIAPGLFRRQARIPRLAITAFSAAA